MKALLYDIVPPDTELTRDMKAIEERITRTARSMSALTGKYVIVRDMKVVDETNGHKTLEVMYDYVENVHAATG